MSSKFYQTFATMWWRTLGLYCLITGLASIIKCLLAMEHKELPPSITHGDFNESCNIGKLKLVQKPSPYEGIVSIQHMTENFTVKALTLVH